MSDLSELYQQVILDHNKNPHNFKKLNHANRTAEGYNPLCGDRLSLYLQMEGDEIKDISFEGSGCAISKASSSMMTVSVKGKKKGEALRLFQKFQEMVTSDYQSPKVDPELGKLEIFSGVCEFPARIKCASLAWHTLQSALEGKKEPVSTEEEKEND